MKKTVLILMLLISQFSFAKPTDDRFFELRVYYCNPGKLDALVARFRDHTVNLFKKHGIEGLGYWIPTKNTDNTFYYLTAYPNKEARDASWKEFGNDPVWKEAARKSEENGKIIAKSAIYFLKATDFSPKIKASKGEEMRTFEMRIYTAMPGKLQNLESRFRDHTMKIFKNNDMQNIVYFTTIENDSSVQAKLLYFLAYKNEAAGRLSWENFRKDPDWIKASTASEVNGKLVEKVESVYMQPTVFSKFK
uniref:NIPSNAP family protein n=1 Tax=Daejeonella sp. TaxID=2805397 RepID=UPI00404A28F3